MDPEIFEILKETPEKIGVYFFKDSLEKIIYVGKAINLKKRLSFYKNNQNKNDKINRLVEQAKRIEFVITDSEIEALLLEVELIKKFRPKFNVIWKDDKRPLYIAVSAEDFPRVYLSRKTRESKLTLYGPFPSSHKARSIYKMLRRIFTFCSEKKPKKPCFYSHINLCSPCPGMIYNLAGQEKTIKSWQYRRQIKQLKKFLQGRLNPVIKEITGLMTKAAKTEEFELAGFYKKRLDLLTYLQSLPSSLDQYLTQPSILADIGKEQSRLLADFLKIGKAGLIEGYDIANISGKLAVGSLVCFDNGLPDKDKYRRFKIKGLAEPNDTKMLEQVLCRRLKHREWSLPDVFMVDGGKGQVSVFIQALEKQNLAIPVVGLSKRREEIIIKRNDQFAVYNFSLDSPILQLLINIRNEAHRFATQYYKKLQHNFLLQ